MTSRWLPLCPQPLLLHLQDNYDLGILSEEDTLLHKPCVLTGSLQRRGSATGPTPPTRGRKRCWLDHFSDKIIAPPIDLFLILVICVFCLYLISLAGVSLVLVIISRIRFWFLRLLFFCFLFPRSLLLFLLFSFLRLFGFNLLLSPSHFSHEGS